MTLYLANGVLNPMPPFDFGQSLSFLGEFKPMHSEQTLTDQSLTKAVFVGDQLVVFEVRATGRVNQPRLSYTLYSASPINADVRAAAEDRVAFFLSLDDDLHPFYDRAKTDLVFAPLVEKLYGYHQVKFLTPFENACWAVLTQRNPMPMAAKMKQALIDAYGASLMVDGKAYAAFPVPNKMGAEKAELNDVIHNQQKADYLSAVVDAFRRVNEGWLRDAPYAEVEAWLREIRGIGAWSANFILLRGLGRLEHAPLAEARLKEVVRRHYGNRSPEEVAQGYGPWQGYWAHYLRVGG